MGGTPTVISAQTVLCGDVASSTAVYVEGKVVGNIRCDCLVVRKGGAVQGDVIANTVILDGTVVGTVRTMNAHLKKNAIIEGSLTYAKIVADHGSQITGQMFAEKDVNTTKNIIQNHQNGYITQDINNE